MKYAFVLAAAAASLVSALPQQAGETAAVAAPETTVAAPGTKLPWKPRRGYGKNIPGCPESKKHEFDEDCDGTMAKCNWYILYAKEYKSFEECKSAHEDQPEADKAFLKAEAKQKAEEERRLEELSNY